MATGLTFATFNLQTNNIITSDIDHFSIPEKDAKLYALAHANQSSLPFVSYPSKTINTKGYITDTTIALLDTRLDLFKGYFIGTDQNLDIDYAGGTRRYIATVNKLGITRPNGLTYATFDIEFMCTQPFGQNTAATTALTATGRTLSGYTDSHTFIGTAPYQLPVITITYTAVVSGTGYMIFSNGGNGQGISITRTWAASDVLVIDCAQKTVTVNGVAVTFTGAFPEFPPGAQTFSYSDGFTSRTFNVSVVYNAMFL